MRKKVGVAGIIPLGRTVLVLRRSHTDGFLPGAYDLPGGGIEPGESPDEGIGREVLEETGLHTTIVKTLGSRGYILDPDSGKRDKILIVYLLRVAKGGFRITLSKEHDEYRWVSDSDLGGIFGSGDLMRSVIHEYFTSDSSR
ncbi:MAG: NUDIX domain-containing protein [Nitrososphaerales archaeon]